MSNEIIFINPNAKPIHSSETIYEAPLPVKQVKRLRIRWGQEETLGVPDQSAASVAPKTSVMAVHPPQQKESRVNPATNPDRPNLPKESRPIPLAFPRIQPEPWEQCVKLEDSLNRLERFRAKTQQSVQETPSLEYLSILKRPTSREHQLGNRVTGQVLIHYGFLTAKHCLAAAVELEQTFNMPEVLKLRPSETMERIEEIVYAHWHREKTEIACNSLLSTTH